MRRTWMFAAAAAAALLCGTAARAACSCRHHHRHAWHSAHVGRAFHIPRFSQAEAEAEVHTVYRYRTLFGPPWPEFFDPPQ